jgi:hypothetical protein
MKIPENPWPVSMLAAAGVAFLLMVAGCAPRAQLKYPVSDHDQAPDLESALARLSPGDKIRLHLEDGEYFEARFKNYAADSLFVHKLLWKKQILGRKLVKSDEVTGLALGDIEQLHTYGHTPLQKIGIGVVLAWGIVGVISMSTLMSD